MVDIRQQLVKEARSQGGESNWGFDMDNVNLSGRAFQLGNIHYVVSHHQQYNSPVRCYREENNVVSIVHLPLVFVLEQLAVEIRLVEPG